VWIVFFISSSSTFFLKLLKGRIEKLRNVNVSTLIFYKEIIGGFVEKICEL